MNISKINRVNETLNKLAISKISVEELKTTLKLQKALTAEIDNFQELQKKIIESYGVEADEKGTYSWAKHKKEKEINEKVNELFEGDITIDEKVLNYMNEDTFFRATAQAMNLQEVSLLSDILVEQEKPAPKKKKQVKK